MTIIDTDNKIVEPEYIAGAAWVLGALQAVLAHKEANLEAVHAFIKAQTDVCVKAAAGFARSPVYECEHRRLDGSRFIVNTHYDRMATQAEAMVSVLETVRCELEKPESDVLQFVNEKLEQAYELRRNTQPVEEVKHVEET